MGKINAKIPIRMLDNLWRINESSTVNRKYL